MSSVIEILQLYGFPDREVHDLTVHVAQNVQTNLHHQRFANSSNGSDMV